MREEEGARGTSPRSGSKRNRPLLHRPPLIETPFRPEDVYNPDELALLADWLRKTLSCKSKEGFELAVKGVSESTRRKISTMLQHLREQGYYPEEVDDNGIVWGIALKSAIQIRFENPTPEEILLDQQSMEALKRRVRQSVSTVKDSLTTPFRRDVS